MGLHTQGYLDKDIAKIFIDRNIPTPLNELWFAKHVWDARNYLRKGQEDTDNLEDCKNIL